jgi:hypothetical protein
MGFRSDVHLLLGSEPTPPDVTAWQHPKFPDSFTVTLDTADLSGHIAVTGNPSQLIELLGRMTRAVADIATARGKLPTTKAPTQPTEPATTRSS